MRCTEETLTPAAQPVTNLQGADPFALPDERCPCHLGWHHRTHRTLTADQERFMPRRTTDGKVIAVKGQPELNVLIEGIFDHCPFLDLVRDFTVYGQAGSSHVKIIAGYHQFHAVRHAVEKTISAKSLQDDRKVGVIWRRIRAGHQRARAPGTMSRALSPAARFVDCLVDLATELAAK
jgi:hypothetical protein